MKNVLRFLFGFLGFLLMISSGYYFSLGMGISIGILGALMFVWAFYPLIKEGLENEKYKFNWRDFSPIMKERRKRWKMWKKQEIKTPIKNLFLTSNLRKRY